MVQKKITKKMLREPDEFITLTQRSILFVEAHSKKIVTAAIVVAVIVVGVVFFQMSQRKTEEEAGRKLAAATTAYQNISSPYRDASPAEYKSVLAGFEEIAKQYPKTSAGKFSILYRGDILLKLGDFDEAIKAFQAFLQTAGKEKLYRLFALDGLGYAHEGKKDYAKAIEAYQQIVSSGETFQSEDAHLGLGRCYERLGKNKEALDNYNAFLKTANKNQRETNTVLRKVSLLAK
jgi:tetratricopeptide (TPR) repeat protein